MARSSELEEGDKKNSLVTFDFAPEITAPLLVDLLPTGSALTPFVY